MKIAIPVEQGKLSSHFGHCEKFAMIEIDQKTKTITHREDIDAPPHEPGKLPPWLASKGAQLIIAGGMGGRAKELFAASKIETILGAPCETPELLVKLWLEGRLQSGANSCNHPVDHVCDGSGHEHDHHTK
ncbi:MAG: NifB/NifX family molybdenum-iron cluster-binding protein [Candidatus Ozemobacteraceae bacterium]